MSGDVNQRKLFGTDGVRGKANIAPIDSETVMRLGRAAACVFRKNTGRHRILIGKDTRVSGYMLETALATGITSMGVDVLLVGPLPTPGIAYMTKSMRADAGVVISASHNPYEDNGIKFFGADGFKLADETEAEIESLMEPGHLDELRATPELIGKAFRIDDAVGRYTVFLKSCVERECSFEGLKIVLDCGNGAAYKVAPLVFSELGAEVITIGDKPDGKNINDKCGSLYPEKLVARVKESNAFCGIAFDGDADRVLFCDEKGNVLDGDILLGIIAQDFLERGLLKGGVVGTIMSNMGFENHLKSKGINFIRAQVGDRYVLSELNERGLVLGGEQSGHIISLLHNTTGDGILSALLVLSAALKSNNAMSVVSRFFDPYPQVLKNIPVKSKPDLTGLDAVQSIIRKVEAVLGDNGRLSVRYSGTEMKARVMVEYSSKEKAEEYANEILDVIKKEIG